MSKIFISSECHVSVDRIVSDALKTIENTIGTLEAADYTDALDEIGIIVNSFDKEWVSMGFGKPRKYISYKNRSADIRLNIPAEELIAADEKTRLRMVRDNIIDSVKIIDERLNKKPGCSFDGEGLVAYILEKTADIV